MIYIYIKLIREFVKKNDLFKLLYLIQKDNI